MLPDLKEKKNLTIILATNKIELIQQISDTILVLKKGKISKVIPTNEINKIKVEPYF